MAIPTRFDPLVDLDGMWTTQLAERYLPLPELPGARYECLDGRLVMTPAGSARTATAARLCTMAVEFVSPGSRRQDFVDKPMRCAEGRVPYFMRVEISRRLRHAAVELCTLGKFGGYDTVAQAVSGGRLTATAPFPIDFDPADLLP